MVNFGKRLKELRLENCLRQQELGEILFVNQRTVSYWENSVSEPDYDMLVKIAILFDVSTDYLLGLEN